MAAGFDLEKWLELGKESEKEARMLRVGAICPVCGANLYSEVFAAAHSWEYGLPSSVAVWCDGHEDDVGFRVHWEISLDRVEPVES